ncbi:choice-of-anchor M domain-containing protein [Streptomyces sp. M19]
MVWLGLRVRGEGKERGASRSSDVSLSATDVEGPGELMAYLTESLGQPKTYFDSSDGLTAKDTTTLPPAAHTHLNWAFTKPGVYRLTLEAKLRNPGAAPEPVGKGTFTFAVGVDPHTVADSGDTILDKGHTDLTVNLDSGRCRPSPTRAGRAGHRGDPARGRRHRRAQPGTGHRSLGKRFSFLGTPGAEIYQLPQAVLGKHVHGRSTRTSGRTWRTPRRTRS